MPPNSSLSITSASEAKVCHSNRYGTLSLQKVDAVSLQRTAAQTLTARNGEIQGLRTQLGAVREQLERESRAYGELRAQAARHESIARHALSRAEQAEVRVRDLLRELGEARQETTQLTAALQQRPRSAPPIAALKKREAARQARRSPSGPKRAPHARGRAALLRRSETQKRHSQGTVAKSKTGAGRSKRGVRVKEANRTTKGRRRRAARPTR